MKYLIIFALLVLAFPAHAAAECMIGDNRPECGTTPGSVNDNRDFFAENINRGINAKNAQAESEYNDAVTSRNNGINSAKADKQDARNRQRQAVIDFHNAQTIRDKIKAIRDYAQARRDLKRARRDLRHANAVPVPGLPELIPPFRNGSGEGPGGFNSSIDTDTMNRANRLGGKPTF